jgi:hypothetical protein
VGSTQSAGTTAEPVSFKLLHLDGAAQPWHSVVRLLCSADKSLSYSILMAYMQHANNFAESVQICPLLKRLMSHNIVRSDLSVILLILVFVLHVRSQVMSIYVANRTDTAC